jgi:hypothetical protein
MCRYSERAESAAGQLGSVAPSARRDMSGRIHRLTVYMQTCTPLARCQELFRVFVLPHNTTS